MLNTLPATIGGSDAEVLFDVMLDTMMDPTSEMWDRFAGLVDRPWRELNSTIVWQTYLRTIKEGN